MNKYLYLIICIVLIVISQKFVIAQEFEQKFTGITIPANDVELSFNIADRVEKIYVTEGMMVNKGDLLIKLDTNVLDLKLMQLKLEAENDSEILANEAELKQRKQDLDKLLQAFEKGAATNMEVEHARLDLEIANYRLMSAKHTKNLAILKVKEMAEEIKGYSIYSPINGFVEEIFVETGESAKTLEKVIRIVQLNPLIVESSFPTKQEKKVLIGKKVKVKFNNGEITIGKIIFKANVADSASETVKIKIELDNNGYRHAGEQVEVYEDT